METATAAPGKMAAAKSGAGGASRPALLILRETLQQVSFSSVRAFPNSDGCSLEGTSSNPPVCPSQGASVHHPLPEDWPVPQALPGPAYLSAETSSAVMAAVAVDSAAIVPLRWWANGRDTACEKNRRNSGHQRLIQGQKMADWRPRAAGSSYIPGPFAPPIHFRILPLEFKGPGPRPKPTQGYPPPAPSGSAGYLSSLVCLPRRKQLFASLASRVRTRILALQLLTGRWPAASRKEASAALHF